MSIKLSIFDLLRKHYPENQYALLEEVRDKAGFYASRSADFISVGLWPSRGLHVNGIELKSFRSDWLSELKKPQKAENIFQYCDFFWLLTSEESVAKVEEIPANWGWMSIKGSRIIIKKSAPKLNPIPFTNSFLAATLKRACDKSQYVRQDKIQDRIDEARESGRNETTKELDYAVKQFSQLRKMVDEFKVASGIDLEGHYRWRTSPTQIGEAVKLLEEGGSEPLRKELIHLESTAAKILFKIQEGLKSLNETKTTATDAC